MARIDNTPGKVTLKNGRIHEFCKWKSSCYSTGEILLTNRLWEWKEIEKGCTIPKNVVKNGLYRWGDEVFVGKSLCGEPGWLYPSSNKTEMCHINCYKETYLHHGYILVYSDDT